MEKEYGFIRADHAGHLVKLFVEDWNMLNFDAPEALTVDYLYRHKEQFRPALQQFGYEVGFNEPSQARDWLIKTLSIAGCSTTQARCPGAKPSVCPDKNVVFDPFRGERQAAELRALGFTLVQINIGEVTRCERAWALGKSCGAVLASMEKAPELELGVDDPDISLVGELPVDVLGRTLMHRPEDMVGLQMFGNR